MPRIIALLFLFLSVNVHAQYFNLVYHTSACAGNPLSGASGIYLYAGAGTSSSTATYDYSAGTFSGPDLGLTNIGNNDWQICFDPYTIFRDGGGNPLPAGTTIYNFTINFRDSSGSTFTGVCGSGSYIKVDYPMTNPQTLYPNIVTATAVTTCTSAIGENESTGIAVYPNPAKQGTTFYLPQAAQGATVLITDLTGKTVRTATVNDKWFFNCMDANGSRLPPGLYHYVILLNGKKETGKLIIE